MQNNIQQHFCRFLTKPKTNTVCKVYGCWSYN